jgi:hypothetical protein
MSEDNSERKGCLIFALVAFGLAAIKPLLALIFGASTEEIYSMETYNTRTDEVTNDIEYLRLTFVLLIVALIIYGYNKYKKG